MRAVENVPSVEGRLCEKHAFRQTTEILRELLCQQCTGIMLMMMMILLLLAQLDSTDYSMAINTWNTWMHVPVSRANTLHVPAVNRARG